MAKYLSPKRAARRADKEELPEKFNKMQIITSHQWDSSVLSSIVRDYVGGLFSQVANLDCLFGPHSMA
jgi:hypothetical protein